MVYLRLVNIRKQFETCLGVKMTPPTVRHNTFVQENPKTNFDYTSKILIIFELLCGINRLPVLSNIRTIFIVLSLAFSLAVNIAVIYLIVMFPVHGFNGIVRILKLCQYCICAVLAFALRNTLNDFYSQLDKFDKETGCSIVNKEGIKNIIHFLLSICLIILILTLMHVSCSLKMFCLQVVIILFTHIAELHYYGHLFSLLKPRLKYINHSMKSSFNHPSYISTVDNEFKGAKDSKHSPIDMKKLMDLYHRIIIAFDILNEAIKWQMLTTVVCSFIASLSLSFVITLRYIHGTYTMVDVLDKMSLGAFEMLPLFVPCRVIDAVHGEVQGLIEQLSCKLYENKIEKSSRPVAQALLALMEARDLSYSLLRIFDIDVSFPFKFLGLLVTYLIILLQFEKIINPERTGF